MRKLGLAFLALAAGLLFTLPGASQPPADRDKGPDGKDRPPRRLDGPPPPFELGRVLPPHIQEGLKLTSEQKAQLAKVEKEVKERLLKILTADQKKKLEELKRRPPPPPRDGGGERRPPEKDRGGKPPPPEEKK